ncbi:MAG: response regulator [Myxococcales bacterium]|nr:response regulator [Myxococcales bacterium]
MNLRHLGDVELVFADDGMAGLRYLIQEDFDLALVDINMPVMDGLTLLRLYLEDETEPKVPIVIVTTDGGDETGDEVLGLGASAFITKPINGEKLRKVAIELIEKFQSD